MTRLRPSELSDPAAAAAQVGALCWRIEDGAVAVLLVTSRDTGRWVIPKGWPIPGLAPHEAALREAWEEAGVRGLADPAGIGSYGYLKTMPGGTARACVVTVYPVAVRSLARSFPEKRARKRRWMRPDGAAAAVQEPGLAVLLRGFDPAARA